MLTLILTFFSLPPSIFRVPFEYVEVEEQGPFDLVRKVIYLNKKNDIGTVCLYFCLRIYLDPVQAGHGKAGPVFVIKRFQILADFLAVETRRAPAMAAFDLFRSELTGNRLCVTGAFCPETFAVRLDFEGQKVSSCSTQSNVSRSQRFCHVHNSLVGEIKVLPPFSHHMRV